MRFAFLLVAACGPKAVEPVKPLPPVRPVTPQTVCARFGELVKEECPAFSTMSVTPAQCPSVFQMALDDPSSRDGRVLSAMGQCMVDHPTCSGVTLCIAAIEFENPKDLRACTDTPDIRAVGVPRAQFEQRNGANVTRLADVHSTKEKPIEMCGISGGVDWLVATTCNDGSHPLASRADAEQARVQNVGRGGTCNSVIDLYHVTCADTAYDVYVDGYVCPLP